MPEASEPNVDESRANLRRTPNCRFINYDEYRTLVISTRRLFRADEVQAAVRGLLDPSTGTRYFMEEETIGRHF